MTAQDLEVGGGAIVVVAAFLYFLNYRLKKTESELNVSKLETQEKENQIEVSNLSATDLKSELVKDGFGPSDPNKPKPGA